MDPVPLFDHSTLPPDLDARVRAELRRNERLLWVGQPKPARFARSAIPISLFGALFGGFAVFWIAGTAGMLFGAGGGGAPGGFRIFPLSGVPLVLVGLGMLSSPLWAWRRARRTCYALTDRRAIVWAAGWLISMDVRSYRSAELNKVRRVEHADGSGDLIFEETVTTTLMDEQPRTSVTQHGFLAIDQVRDIEDLLRAALLPDNPLESTDDPNA